MIYNNGQDEAKWLQAKPINDAFAGTISTSTARRGTISEWEKLGLNVPAGQVFVGKES